VRVVAYCGLVCSECPAYIATQADDLAAKEIVLEKWRIEYNHPGMTIADVTCDGCATVGGRLGGHPPVCSIRVCAKERAVRHCGACSDYACEKVSGLLDAVPPARALLDELRARQ
jgi:hypothetical protein